MEKPRAWTVEKLSAVHQALMELSELVEGAEHRFIAHHKDGLGKRVSNWLRDNNSEFYLDISDAGVALRYLVCMRILSESPSRKDRSRIFHSSIEITDELIDEGYKEMRTRYR